MICRKLKSELKIIFWSDLDEIVFWKNIMISKYFSGRSQKYFWKYVFKIPKSYFLFKIIFWFRRSHILKSYYFFKIFFHSKSEIFYRSHNILRTPGWNWHYLQGSPNNEHLCSMFECSFMFDVRWLLIRIGWG